MPTTAFRDLRVWQQAMDLVVEIYKATQHFPDDELFGLIAQMRRAAVSVPSNIAEGKGRFSRDDQVHFFLNSRGSLLELETQVLISSELSYLQKNAADEIIEHIVQTERLLNGLINALKVPSAA